jgi:hypothetical protein
MSREVDQTNRPIGGFFGLAIEDVPTVPGSIWEEWTKQFRAVSTFSTARAALAALIGTTAPRRIWLPAYLCREASDSAVATAVNLAAAVCTYGLTDELDPDVGCFSAQLAAGDLVVVVDYFGWLPSQAFRDWASTRSDIVWVEDRAQAMWTAEPPWAPWCIYSPRKLLGVPNGGLLVGKTAPASGADLGPSPDLAVALPELMRFEDQAQTENDRWYAAYRAREDGLADGSGPMSRMTEALLRRIHIEPLVAARQANYRYLLDRLPALAAWPRNGENVAPFGLAIAVEDAPSLARQLAAERLFCPRHWAELNSDPARFTYEHGLSRQLLTLPCDHRYTAEQLARLADAIDRLAPNPGCVRRNLR